jgi:hypothetical protein
MKFIADLAWNALQNDPGVRTRVHFYVRVEQDASSDVTQVKDL